MKDGESKVSSTFRIARRHRLETSPGSSVEVVSASAKHALQRRLPGTFARLYEEDRAVALIIFTIMLAALLGLAALVTDVGLGYVNRRAMQNAVDAAALAGAHYLPDSPAQAVSVARAYANQDGVTNAEIDAVTSSQYKIQVKKTYSDHDTIVVSAQRSAPYVFRKIVGGGDTTIFVTSSSLVTVQVPKTGLAPLAVSLTQVATNSNSQTPTPCATTYVECVLKDSTNGAIGGNFQEINWSSVSGSTGCSSASGGSTYLCYLENGYSGPVPTPVGYSNGLPVWNWPINTYPGNRGSNNDTAVSQLFTWDQGELCHGGATSCANLYESPPAGVPNLNPTSTGKVCYNDVRCPRVVVVPTISQSWDVNGNTGVNIVTFSCFYVTQQLSGSAGHSEIIGMFIDHCQGTDSTAIYGVPLNGSGANGEIIAPVLWQ